MLSNILKKVASKHEYTVKNGEEFVKGIKNIKIRPGDQMISFDVVSLFTKVPIKETLKIIKKRLQDYDNLNELTKLSINDLMELIKICLKSTYFKYNSKFYHQTEGTAMGSPISPIVAEIFMQELEKKLVKNNRNIIYWRRFVDDVFAIIRIRRKSHILSLINSFHESIQFTFEDEQQGQLPFLDLMLYKKPDNSIGHQIYRKPTHTNLYLNYHSFHPPAHKIGVTDTLLTRALRLSDEDHLENEIKYTIKILEENNYPRKMIEYRLKKVKNKMQYNNNNNSLDEPVKRIILPWAGETTTKIARFLERKLEMKIGYIPGPKLSRMLTNTKEKPRTINCGIYSIQCSNCPAKYIGETGRDYTTRIQEHIHAIRSGNVRLSPVALHMHEHEHNLDPNSYKLILKEPRRYFRKFKEALFIKSTTNKMNISRGVAVSPIWSSTLTNFLTYTQ